MIRTNMQEKESIMRVNQLVSDYLTLSREQGWTLVMDEPKLAIKHLLSVVKPAQLKEVCNNDLLLDQIGLRKDFYGFAKRLRKTAADADRWAATNRTGVSLTQVRDRELPRTVPLAPLRARLQSILMIRHATSTGRQTITV
jgi:hypothetical protein